MKYIYLSVLLIVGTLVFGITLVYALFHSSASSNNNTFASAAVFPTVTQGITPTITSVPTSSITPTPTSSSANHIVISEVQVASSAADDEFIEIYNPTSSIINLSTLPLHLHIINSSGTDVNKTLTFVNNTIPAHGFFLIGPAVGYTGSVSLNATYASTGNKLVSNGAFYVSNSTTNKSGVIDLVGFGTAAASDREGTALSNPPDAQSWERKANALSTVASMTSGVDVFLGNGWDMDNNSTDFILRPSSQPQNNSSFIEP